MAQIYINLEAVNNANAKLPRYIADIYGVSRELKISMWKMNPEIMRHRDMDVRMRFVLSELNRAQNQLQNIHHIVSSAVMEYDDMERIATNRADAFY